MSSGAAKVQSEAVSVLVRACVYSAGCHNQSFIYGKAAVSVSQARCFVRLRHDEAARDSILASRNDYDTSSSGRRGNPRRNKDG
jgi:hypothetical protein